MKAKFKVGDKVKPASKRGKKIWKGFFGNAKLGKIVGIESLYPTNNRNGYKVKVGLKYQPMFSYELEKV